MSIRRVVLIYPKRDGRILNKAHGSPYTLMRLASLVPDAIPVEIWDENLMRLPLDTLGPDDLVGASAMSLGIDQVKEHAQIIHQQGARIVVGGTHATLVPDEVEQWADAVVVGEAYRTWPQIIRDFDRRDLQKRYTDEEWADLKGVAPISDRVIQMVGEHHNYWTPMLEITRGCPRNCSFCTAIRVSGKIMRHRPIPEVVDEIRRRRIKRFFLTDDNFGLNFRTGPSTSYHILKVLAGGQSLVPMMNFRIASPSILIDLNQLSELDFIREDAGGLAIGAMTRQRQLERDRMIAQQTPLLAETMPFVAHPQIRNRGTVGGSLAHADPAAELPAVMVALGAKFRLASQKGERIVPAADFFQGLFATALDQRIGTGDGVTRTFFLQKTYGSRFAPWTQRITKPAAGSVRIAVELVIINGQK